MPTVTTLEANHKLSCQLSADAVDVAHGIIRGCTVVKSGIQATGKFVMLDARGQITRDPDLMASEVPVFTDETTLTTLMTAAKAAGDRIKTREDHDDAIGARVGFADALTLTGDGRVTADIHLLKSYQNRELVLETAMETPGEIGLSIDFTPTFELRDGKAFMRVQELNAIDLVDEGAATPAGLFLSVGVDTGRKVETTRTIMAASPTIEELAATIAKTNESHAALTKQMADISAALAKLTATPAKTEDESLKAAKADALKLAAEEIKTLVSAAFREELVKLKRERAALKLGLTASDEVKVKLASASPEEIDKIVTDAKPKDYLALVADRIASAKCSRMAAHDFVRENHKAEYNTHRERGFARFTTAA